MNELNILSYEHPGILLREEYMEPLGITPYRLAKESGLSQTQIGEILSGKRSITAPASVLISQCIGTSPGFWARLQVDYDVYQAQHKMRERLNAIKPLAKAESV